ncbi:MAG: hypothetical protein SGJ27_14890 [Candidatus Melainabacteria bacterium]|nr:hypothetical protein [Candidatus Melainabacteria bacterium]
MEPESNPVNNDEAGKIETGVSKDSDKSESLLNVESSEPDSEALTLSSEELEKIDEPKLHATSFAGKPETFGTEGSITPPQPYRSLDSVLDHDHILRNFKQPMLFDVVLALGLLVAVAGFTTGLMRIYITHMAKQSINQHNYKAAITILKRNPVPEFFSGFGSDPNDLLNQALYLDAMTKLEANNEDQSALSQLSKITSGSRFFHLAQDILSANGQGPDAPKVEKDESDSPKEPLFKTNAGK